MVAVVGIVFKGGIMGADTNANDGMLLQPVPLGGSQGQLRCGRGSLGGDGTDEEKED
jgi:hypothetical protein